VDRAEQRHLPRRRFRGHVGFSLPWQGVAGAERQGGQRIQACPKRGDLLAQQRYLSAVLAASRSRYLGGHPSNTALTRVMLSCGATARHWYYCSEVRELAVPRDDRRHRAARPAVPLLPLLLQGRLRDPATHSIQRFRLGDERCRGRLSQPVRVVTGGVVLYMLEQPLRTISS
jgi:hypothetical protein